MNCKSCGRAWIVEEQLADGRTEQFMNLKMACPFCLDDRRYIKAEVRRIRKYLKSLSGICLTAAQVQYVNDVETLMSKLDRQHG